MVKEMIESLGRASQMVVILKKTVKHPETGYVAHYRSKRVDYGNMGT